MCREKKERMGKQTRTSIRKTAKSKRKAKYVFEKTEKYILELESQIKSISIKAKKKQERADKNISRKIKMKF